MYYSTRRKAVATSVTALIIVAYIFISYSGHSESHHKRKSNGVDEKSAVIRLGLHKDNSVIFAQSELQVALFASNSSQKMNPPVSRGPTKPNEFYLITMLSVFNGRPWPNYNVNYTTAELNARDEEYLDTIQVNINQDYVKELHLFFVEDDALKLVHARNFTNKHKIKPIKGVRRLHMADFFIYSSKNFVDKAVIAMNGDIMLGYGFQNIDTERMRDEKVLYSLTRHGVDKKAVKCVTDNMCLDIPYEGSHDTHIFRLAAPLNETFILDRLDYPINMWQAENGMLWTFRNSLKFTVRNPCKVLYTYHNHCSKVHGPSGTWDHVYSIVSIPNKGWKWQMVLDSFTPVEDKLAYGG